MTPTGLLGGSFNPAHGAHRRISLFAARALGLDEVWWLVSPGNPLKPEAGMAPLAARLASAERMARRAPIRPTAIEAALGTRYTVDTLRALVRRYPDRRFVWLMGADNLAQLHRWRDWRGIARTMPIAVIARPGYERIALAAPAMGWLRRWVRPARQARIWTSWSCPALVLLRFDPDPRSATAMRAKTPRWHLDITRPPAAHDRVTHRPLTPGGHLPASVAAHRPLPADPAEVEALHRLVLDSLDDDQAVDLVTIPLQGKSSIADHMVIASGRSTRQVASMAAKLAEKIKSETGRSPRIEGLAAADWVLLDAGDVIVHLFRPEVRSFYNLERMWAFGDAPPAGPGAPLAPAAGQA